MLQELRVENLLLIERAEMQFGSGLNVVTGETGAGKTVLAHALDLILGTKPRSGIVRPGAAEAWVEGVFSLPEQLPEGLAERIPQDAEELVLARRVSAEGRSRAFICGRSATASDLREVGEMLVAFHGQSAVRQLLSSGSQLDLLDRFCGPAQQQLLAEHADAYGAERDAKEALAELLATVGGSEREQDMLRFELEEIESVAPVEAERDELEVRREKLAHLDSLQQASHGASEAIGGDEGGAVTSLAAAESLLEGVSGFDSELDQLARRVQSLRIEADDVHAEIRQYTEQLEAQPDELAQIEERLQLISRLERKYGGSIEAVLAHADACRQRLETVENLDQAVETAESELGLRTERRTALAKKLHKARERAAKELASETASRLPGLAMPGARVEIEIQSREPGVSGEDRVEVMLAPNSGVPLAPLKDAASGGELSRVTLALLSVVGENSGVTQVFDEIDSGVGGQTGRAVGERLKSLADGGQVLCITHLPQIAALADRHFSIDKDASKKPVRTTVTQLDEKAVVEELVRMLGGEEGGEGARLAAQELRVAA